MDKCTSKQFYFCLVIISAISFVWLISPLLYSDVWKGNFQQKDPDSLLFARFLEQSILKGSIQKTDNYGAYPYEVNIGLPPFYLAFLYNLVTVIYAIVPNISIDYEYIIGCVPLLFFVFTSVIIVFSIHKLFENKVLTLMCAFSLLPGFSSAMVYEFFKLDYDYLISFFIWIWILAGAFYIKIENKIFTYIGAVITALFISLWNGSPFFYCIVVILSFLYWLQNPKKSDKLIAYSSFTLLVGSVIALLFVPKTVDSVECFKTFNIGHYSYLQGLLILVGALFLVYLHLIKDMLHTRKKAFLSLFCILIVLFCFFYEAIFQASGILFSKDPVHEYISEIFGGLPINEFFSEKLISYGFARLGIAFFSLPLLLFIEVPIKNKEVFYYIKCWLFIFVVLFVWQIRYIRWPACGFNLLSGFSFFAFYHLIKSNSIKTNKTNKKLIFICLPLMLLSSINNFAAINVNEKFNKQLIELFNWIKQETPEVSGYVDNNKPEYSILAYWDLGNYISYYCKRPVSVSNSLWGYKTMADVFSARSEKEAFDLCKKYGIKYILIQPTFLVADKIIAYWDVLKKMPETPIYKLYYKEVIVDKNEKYENFYKWLSDKLAMTSLGDFACSSHYRVVYSSKMDESESAPMYFLFERVDGAELNLRLEPESIVSVSLNWKSDKYHNIYKRKIAADKLGNVCIKLPYSTNYRVGNVNTDNFYKLTIEGKNTKRYAKLFVSESKVQGKAKIDDNDIVWLND